MQADYAADAAIVAYVRAASTRGGRLERIGPFLLVINPGTTSRHLNYAIPDDGATPAAADIDALVRAFRERDRLPRLEFLPSLSPTLEDRLAGAGFTVEARLPLMTCTDDGARDLPVPPGIRLEEPDDDAAMLEMATLQHEAFAEPDPPGAAGVARIRSMIERGGWTIVARDEASRAVVGAAQGAPPGGGATEIVGVAVAASHRRRGIAAAMVATIARDAFDTGVTTAFLEAAVGADGAYRNAGFRRTSTSLHMSRPDGASA